MQYKCINLENMDLYFVKTDKFKSIDIKVFFCGEVTKEEITWRNCLADILLYATKKYPSRKEMFIKTSELYSLYLTASNMRFGNYLISRIGMSLLNPKYTEEGMLEESLQVLHDVIFDPLVEDNHFNKEYLEYIKKENKADTETIKENPKTYSSIRMLSNMEKDMPYTFTDYSDIEILNQINEYSLYEYYQKFMKNNRVFAVVVGDINEDQITNYFKDNFPLVNKKLDKEIVIKHHHVRDKANVIIEDSDYQQSKLSMAFKIKDLTDFEYRYVLNIYNSILGGGSYNKLMQSIRENNSLAYYVKSGISKADHLMYIVSGIDSKNFDKVIELVEETMKDMIAGNFTEQDIMQSKMEYITSFDEALEHESGYIDIILGQILFDAEEIQKRKEEIMKVTKEDVMKIAEKIYVDTIFLLKGN